MEFLNYKRYVNEYVKCANDPCYFIDTYFKHAKDPIKLYPYQRAMIMNFEENKANIVKSCRQSGKSFITLAYAYWAALFHGKSVCIISNKVMSAENLAKIVQHNIKIGDVGCRINNRTLIEFEDGGMIRFSGPSPSSIRGMNYDLVIIDEMAYIDGIEDLFMSIFPIIASNRKSKIIVTSTINKPDDLFYSLYLESIKSSDSGWKSMDINWWDRPDFHNSKNVESFKKLYGDKAWKKEYECRF